MEAVFKPKPPKISVFHLIIWIFAIADDISKQFQQKIKKMYGLSPDNINPIVKNYSQLKNIIKNINDSNKKCIIKIIVSQQLLNSIKKICRKYSNILQIYLIKNQSNFTYIKQDSKELLIQQKLDNLQKTNQSLQEIQIIDIFNNLQQGILKASTQVQKFTKSFRTFENTNCLIGNFQKINIYRYRLISFINIKISDLATTYYQFRDFAIKQLNSLNYHLKSVKKNQIRSSTAINRLERYYIIAFEFTEQTRDFQGIKAQRQKIDQNDQRFKNIDQRYNEQSLRYEKIKQNYYNEIISIYQEQGLFYQLLNSNLKLVGQKNSNWKILIMPFGHVYNAIKYLYKKNIKENNKQYLNNFYVYRGGRMRRSQLNQYKQYIFQKIFIQFYGFISTSKNARIVAQKFVTFKNSKDSNNLNKDENEDDDEEVIFRIKITQNMKIHQQCYDFFLNGFYIMNQNQKQGDKEQQVLFNALNIFRLLSVSKIKVIDLYNQKDKQQISQKMNKLRNQAHFTYLEQKAKIDYTSNEITVVDLDFGSFYDILLQPNLYQLSKFQQLAKENYVHCMKKIRKIQKYDIADADQLTNQYQQAYSYLKQKTGINQMTQFQASILDNKNYFQRMSIVCKKLGKISQAVKYSKIAVQCHKQLHNAHLNEVYNKHYQKLFEMQTQCVEIYKESSNHLAAQRQLKNQLSMIRTKKFIQPKAKLRQAQVYINQAINYYSMGKLQECINRFTKCSHQLQKAIQTYNKDFSYVFFKFLRNIICVQEGYARTCSYKQYLEMIRKRRQNQYGTQGQLKKSQKMAEDMLKIANQAVKNRKKIFKSRKNYQNLISKINHEVAININKNEQQRQQKQRQKLQQQIKKDILLLSTLDEGQQYSKILSNFNQKIQNLNKIQLNNIQQSKSSFIFQVIVKFKEKLNKKKMQKLINNKQQIIKNNQNKLYYQYQTFAQEIQKSIIDLKSQGYSQNTTAILNKKVQKAQIYYKCKNRDKSIQQIKKIIASCQEQTQNREIQMAKAWLLKAKIQFQLFQYQNTIQTLNKCIQHFKQSVIQQIDEKIDLDLSNITQSDNKKIITNQNNLQNLQKNQLNHNQEYLQAIVLRMKAILLWIQSNQIRVKSKKISFLEIIKEQVLQLEHVIQDRSKLEDLGELRCNWLQIYYQYTISLGTMAQNRKTALNYFQQSFELRQTLDGQKSQKNVILCCQFIIRYHEKINLLNDFLIKDKGKYKKYLQKNMICFCGYSFEYKISKALYLIYSYQKDYENKKKFLIKTINILEQISRNEKHLIKQLQKFKEYQLQMESQNQPSYQPLQSKQYY